MDAEARLAGLGIALPETAAPKAMYVPAVRSGNLLFISGQLPSEGDALLTGLCGAERSLDEAVQGARRCAVNLLAAAKGELGSLDRVRRVVKLQAFVASAPGFTSQHLVANGASELLCAVFGESGRHARTAVAVPCLPLNATVEIEAILEVE